MRRFRLHYRSLVFYWRVHAATAACAAVASTALVGSWVVGDSMRGSLRDQALERIGPLEHALVSARFVREELAGRLSEDRDFRERFGGACPLIFVKGSVERPEPPGSARQVNIFGVDARFWRLMAPGLAPEQEMPDDAILLNAPLADRLRVQPGEDILVRLAAQHAVPVETLLGRADRATATVRLSVGRIIPARGPGGLDLTFAQGEPLNAFVPLDAMQRALRQRGRTNAIFVTARADYEGNQEDRSTLQSLLGRHLQLADLGLKIRPDAAGTGAVLESERLLLEPPFEAAARDVIREAGFSARPTLTHLANSIALLTDPSSAPATQTGPAGGPRDIPYSTVTALNDAEQSPQLLLVDGSPAPPLEESELLLNAWSAKDLGASVGDRVRLTYFVTDPFRELRTEQTDFRLRGIVAMRGLAVDRTLAPEYEGVSDSSRMADWDPPFPMDMKRIRSEDEAYWEEYGPAPKAFVSLKTGQRLWTQTQPRFGRLTSIRLQPPAENQAGDTIRRFEAQLLQRLTPADGGLVFDPVRARVLTASQGSTDFGQLFIAFSVFLIAAALMLMVLLCRLGMERRASEIGLLQAVGFSRRAAAWHLVSEVAWPVIIGTAAGVAGAVGYASMMISGLHGRWSEAVRAGFLRLHVEGSTLLFGASIGLLVALLSAAWAVRGLSRSSPRALLAGATSGRSPARTGRRPRLWGMLAAGGTAAALVLLVLASFRVISPVAACFGGGAALLAAAIAAVRLSISRGHRHVIRAGGIAAMTRLGLSNASRNPLRTTLSIALIASATFVVTAVSVNLRETHATDARRPGTGGYALCAESSVPIVQNLNSREGRNTLGLSEALQDLLADTRILPLRLRSGDEASCLNLYRPAQPRILGATQEMMTRGGFAFRTSMAESPEEKANPWLLLNRAFADGAIPAIGDDSTLTWLLHLGLGDDLVQQDEQGREIRLRIVGLLSGSILQSELVVAESRFVEAFPGTSGYRFFLIDAPAGRAEPLAREMERELNRYGLQVEASGDRLARYASVENAYLAAFQALGGLGVVLGTLGLGAVVWRNMLDRRGELALLRAVGYARGDLRWMIWSEHAALLAWGTFAGAVAGLTAVAPEILSDPQGRSWRALALMLGAILAAGNLSLVTAVAATLRAPLLPALRND